VGHRQRFVPPLLDGRTALVTGGSRGIGAGIAAGLAEAGAKVVITQTGPPAQVPPWITEGGYEETVTVLQSVFDDPSQVAPWAEEVLNQEGRIDILCNSAGITYRAPAEDLPYDAWLRVVNINLNAVFALCQAFGRPMLERRQGKIINVASLMSFQGGWHIAAYAAAKGGVAQLTHALANEWASRGVNVNAIVPGYIATDLTAALRADPERQRDILARIPAARWGEPRDLAGAAVFLASSLSDYVHGHLLAVDGGWLGR
jgi:2-deoxy-D-gluconate 3-dehydrogenase